MELYPSLAPLSESYVRYLFQSYYYNSIAQLPVPMNEKQAADIYRCIWMNFEAMIYQIRLTAFYEMDSLALADKFAGKSKRRNISSSWLQSTLSVSAVTTSKWVQSHLLLMDERGAPNPHSVASLLIAKLYAGEERQRDYLPTIFEREGWSLYSQRSPDDPIQAIPYRPGTFKDLPSDTLLWTPWIGICWDEGLPDWRRISDWGAIAFAGQPSSKEIEQWDPNAKSRRQFGLQGQALVARTLDVLASRLRLQVPKIQGSSEAPP